MLRYIKNAFAELEHVVWPTKRETQSYFKIVVIFIILSTIFLFILGYVFGEAIFGVKNVVSGGGGTNIELIDIPQNINISDVEINTDTAAETDASSDSSEAPAESVEGGTDEATDDSTSSSQ